MSARDESMLRLAAKAAGIQVIRSRLDDPMSRDMLVADSVRNVQGSLGAWNPLTDDGDALRLAVRLRITPVMDEHIVDAQCGVIMCHEPRNPDPCAAARRAIVRAAAAMADQS